MATPTTKREGFTKLAMAISLEVAGDFATVIERAMRLDGVTEAEAINGCWWAYDPDRSA